MGRLMGLLRRMSTGDYVVLLSVGVLALALARPALSARSFRALVTSTVAEVEAFRTGAERVRNDNGEWPASAPPGVIPAEYTGLFVGDSSLVRDRYSLQWQRWDVVDYVEALPDPTPAPVDAPPADLPPEMVPVVGSIAGIVLHTGEADLLAELLARFGPDDSFVRDTTWTLVLPTRGGGG